MLAIILLIPAPLAQYTILGIPACFRSARAPPAGVAALDGKAPWFPF